MIPAGDEVEDFLLRMCLDQDAMGGPQPALLVPIHVRDGTLASAMFPTHADRNVTDWLDRTAVMCAWGATDDFANVFCRVAGPQFCGWLLASEGWVWVGNAQERAALPRRTRFKNHPSARPCRTLIFCDVGDTIHDVTQVRGEQPVYTRSGRGGRGDPVRFGGREPAALRLLTIATARFMPEGTHHMPPLISVENLRRVDIREELGRMPPIEADERR